MIETRESLRGEDRREEGERRETREKR